MKTKEEIRATTGRIPRPQDYKYGEKLKEWDASLPPWEEFLLEHCVPTDDRLLVRLVDEGPKDVLILTDAKQLIGGMRRAVVQRCGPGKRMKNGRRRPVAVVVGQTVYIGNWVDLEANGLALCQEGDVRVWQH